MPAGPTAEVRLAAVLRVLICGVLVATAVTVNASAIHWRQNLADSHLFGYYGWCILLTHVGYECGGNRTETFVILFERLAVLGYVRWLRGRRLAWLPPGRVPCTCYGRRWGRASARPGGCGRVGTTDGLAKATRPS